MDDLVRVLGKKYGISVNSDAEVMDLFNRLCISIDNDVNYKNLLVLMKDERAKYMAIISRRDEELLNYKTVLNDLGGNTRLPERSRAIIKKASEDLTS